MEMVRHAYRTMARRYIELFGSSAKVHPEDLALITRHLSIRAGVVLDVGCGPGHLTEHLRVLDVDVAGIDVVPEFVNHARVAYPDAQYVLGSMHLLPVSEHSAVGILAWYSLIHVKPSDLDEVLVELRRVMVPGAPLVTGFFDGDDVVAFEHKVVTAYYWPVGEFSARLRQAGFTETERHLRPGVPDLGLRAHAAVVARAR